MRNLSATLALLIALGCATPDYSKYTTDALLQDQHALNQRIERIQLQTRAHKIPAQDPNTRNAQEATQSILTIKETTLLKKAQRIEDELFQRAQAARPTPQSPSDDPFAKAMAILNAPTQQTIPIVHSKIKGDFNGWSGDTLFQLANGQIYQQVDTSQYSAYLYRPTCALVPLGNDQYTLVVENIPDYCTVTRLK